MAIEIRNELDADTIHRLRIEVRVLYIFLIGLSSVCGWTMSASRSRPDREETVEAPALDAGIAKPKSIGQFMQPMPTSPPALKPQAATKKRNEVR